VYVQALQIAISKDDGTASRPALQQALLKAEALARVESQFESRVNASKASRGERPTKLSKSRQAEVDGFATDSAGLQAEQLVLFRSELAAHEIVQALKSGLDSDLKFWSTAAKHTHPGDLPVVQEFVDAKRELRESLALCIAGSPGSAA
jgi:hypothetical protein